MEATPIDCCDAANCARIVLAIASKFPTRKPEKLAEQK